MTEKTQTEQDITQRPTIFVTVDEDGDVRFSTNSEEIDVATALLMLEIVRTKLVATHLHGVSETRKTRQNRAILTAPPSIARPDGRIR